MTTLTIANLNHARGVLYDAAAASAAAAFDFFMTSAPDVPDDAVALTAAATAAAAAAAALADAAAALHVAVRDARSLTATLARLAALDARNLTTTLAALAALDARTSPLAERGACARHDIEARGVEVTACSSRLPAPSLPSKAARVAELLQAAGMGCILVEDGAGVPEGWAVDVYDPKLIEAVRAYIEANLDALRLHRFKPPEGGKNASGNIAEWLIAEWLIDRLEWLGVAVVRGRKVSSSQRVRGKRRTCSVTRATVLAAWAWAKQPYDDLVDSAARTNLLLTARSTP